MAEAELGIDLDGLLQTQSVQVVQAIDVDSLKQTLRWIVGKLQAQEVPAAGSATTAAAELQSQVQQLADDNAALRQEIEALRAQQAALAEQMDSKLDKDQLPSASLLNVPDEVAALQQRMGALEGASAAPGSATGTVSEAAAGGDDSATAQRLDALEAGLEELRRGLGDGGRAASAGPGAASTHGGLDGSGSGGSGARPGSGRGGEGDGRRAGSAREGEQGASAGGAERPGSARAAGDDGVGADADEAAVAAGSGGDGSGSSGGGSGGASGRTSFKSPLGGDAAPGTAEDLAGIRQALGELQQQLQAKADKRSVEQLRAQAETMREQLSSLQPEELQLRLESSARDIAALSSRVRDLDEDRSVGLEALEAAVAALKEAMAGKADAAKVDKLADKVSDLGIALADKADKTALDELRLRMALASPGRPGSGTAATSGLSSPGGAGAALPDTGGGGGGTGVGNTDGLIQLIQGMLADKAGKAEVAALKEALDGKASLEELEAMRLQLIVDGAGGVGGAGSDVVTTEELTGNYARKDDLNRLADQMGDMYAEVERMRHNLVQQRAASGLGLPSKPSSAKHQAAAVAQEEAVGAQPQAGQSTDSMALVQSLRGDLQALKDQLEMVAHATNILAVGLEPRAAASSGSAPQSPMPHASLAPNATGGRESRQAAGAYDRLLKLLGSQSVSHKMDFFDPEVLNRMSQKMATVDALLKNPSFGRGQGIEDLGVRELEAQMRKVTRDIKVMKERVAQGLPMVVEGDHAMLAGKPAVLGYRCMACDRPIDKLDNTSGPHIPTYQMTAKMHQMKMEAAKGGPKNGIDSPPLTSRKKAPYDPAQRGPQTWYEDCRPLPAEGLPPADVGPKLAPGGWRASATGKAPNGLPDMPPGARPASPQVAQQGDSRGSARGPVYELPRLV